MLLYLFIANAFSAINYVNVLGFCRLFVFSNRIESILRPFVYDSPVNAPMFENVHYLRPIFNVKTQQYRIEKHLRQLRTEFHENVTERLVSLGRGRMKNGIIPYRLKK